MNRFDTLQREFPDYDVATLPPIPEHWADSSWHNDICPSFVIDDELRVFVDYADQSLSEWAGEPDYQRFIVQPYDLNDACDADLYQGNDWNAVLWTVALHSPINDRPAAERFIEALHAAGLSYHFDDGAIDCLYRNGALSIEDAERVDLQIADCYAAWEASGADLAHDCPIGHAIKVMEASELRTLASAARPIDDDDYGSERQIAAENEFFRDLARRWPAEFDDGSQFAAWGLKATTDELIDEGLKRALALIA